MNGKFTVGSMFSGIGGLELGLERTGCFETRWQCEINDYARRVLAKNWPGLPIYNDIKELYESEFPEKVDVLCGGFPCQPFSTAGKRMGEADERFLWPEFVRVVRQVRPRWVIAENVPGLLTIDAGRVFGRILWDLASCGYDVEWDTISAASVGALHPRNRIFIVGRLRDADRPSGERSLGRVPLGAADARGDGQETIMADAISLDARTYQGPGQSEGEEAAGSPGRRGENVPDPSGEGGQLRTPGFGEFAPQCGTPIPGWSGSGIFSRRPAPGGQWAIEPDVGGGIDGFPDWMDRHVGRGLSYAESRRRTEVLRDMWSPDVAEKVWRTIGGLERVQAAEVLFAFVRQYENGPEQAWIFMEGQEAPEGQVRDVRRNGYAGGASHQREQGGQQIGEYNDVVRSLPCSLPSWEFGIPRVSSGIPSRVDRLRCLGNAVVPQCAEYIGELIIEWEGLN